MPASDPQPVAVGASGCAAVILSSRESPEVLREAVQAIAAEPALRGGVLDVLINGNRSLAEACAARFGSGVLAGAPLAVRLWFLPLGDKAHAWNTYVHALWPGAECTVFADGYAKVMPAALGVLRQGLMQAPDALAATGVPSVGRSAVRLRRDMVQGGGIHGNLFALNREAMDLARATGFRLPLGLYRTDALLGAALFFRFAPELEHWEIKRIRVLPEATWRFDPLRWWHPADLAAHGRRLLRQQQGVLENRACRHLLAERRLKLDALGTTAAQMVEAWLTARPDQAAQVRRSPLLAHALRRLRQPRDWSSAAEPATLMWHAGDGFATNGDFDADAFAPALGR